MNRSYKSVNRCYATLLLLHTGILQAEAEERAKAWESCTAEAQKLASQFSEAEFISSLIPDPIEHGVVDGLRKLVAPMMGKTAG